MQIRVRPFIHKGDGDYEMISKWYGDWEQECPPKDCLAAIGFIVEESVAGFLYTTNSRVCMIDSFISSTEITGLERDTALDVLVHSLMDAAKELDNRVIVANSIQGTIRNRALKNGFSYIGEHGVFFKEVR